MISIDNVRQPRVLEDPVAVSKGLVLLTDFISAEVDGVTEVGVIGTEDRETGEAVVAYVVVPRQDPVAAAEAVRAHCATRLARFKQPARIEIVDELPLTITGKVQKGRLRGIERRRALGLLE